jgi:hypothetical protein
MLEKFEFAYDERYLFKELIQLLHPCLPRTGQRAAGRLTVFNSLIIQMATNIISLRDKS